MSVAPYHSAREYVANMQNIMKPIPAAVANDLLLPEARADASLSLYFSFWRASAESEETVLGKGLRVQGGGKRHDTATRKSYARPHVCMHAHGDRKCAGLEHWRRVARMNRQARGWIVGAACATTGRTDRGLMTSETHAGAQSTGAACVRRGARRG